MRTPNAELKRYFTPLFGKSPRRARLGYGSFVTFDFGQASRQNHRLRYEWHLWIQYVEWQLTWKNKKIADSESMRRLMQAAVERLETRELSKVLHDPRTRVTRFLFSEDAELRCKGYSDASVDEDCWSLYTPDAHILFADHTGKLQYVRSDLADPTASLGADQDSMAEA